jgi:hypothetical protein
MGTALGDALMYLGKEAPGIGKSFDDARKTKEEQEMERQRLAAALASMASEDAVNKQTLADKQYASSRTKQTDTETDTRKGAARSAYDSWKLAKDQAAQAQNIAAVNEGGYPGPITPENAGKLGKISKMTPVQQMEEYNLPYHAAADPGIESMIKQENIKGKEKSSGLFSGWKRKNDDRDAILSGINPYNEGKEFSSEEEKNSAEQEWEKRWNTSGALGITDRYIEGAANKAKEVQLAQIPGKTTEASAVGSAGTRARETTQREVQREQPMFSGPQAIAISQSAIAVKNLQRLREELQKGNVGYFDIIKKTGQFANPKVNNAYQQVGEIVGRSQSGAAIADHEWKNFGKEILNPQFLLTEQGRKTALENIDDYMERFYSNGQLITSDPDWYKNYQGRTKKGMEEALGNKDSTDDVREFATEAEAEAEAAGLKPGTRIKVAGRSATWQ